MDPVYLIPGAAALIEWMLAAILYALAWYGERHFISRAGDSLAVAGLVTALGGGLWMAWELSPNMALAPSSMATGLAVSTLAVYAVLAHRRSERLSALAILGLAILLQAFAVGRLWWGVEPAPSVVLLPLGAALRALTGLVGYAALAVAGMTIALSFGLARARDRLSVGQWAAATGLADLEWRSLQIATLVLALSLSMGAIHSWWGLGQIMTGGFVWDLITWLLAVAGTYGLMRNALPRRAAHSLLALALVTGIAAVLTWR